MSRTSHWMQGLALAGVALTTLGGCSNGGQDGQGMTPGPGARIDAFTSAVVTIAKDSPEDAVPAEIGSIAVVWVDDQPAATFE